MSSATTLDKTVETVPSIFYLLRHATISSEEKKVRPLPTSHSKLFLSKTQRVEFSCYPKEHSIRRRWKTGIHLATVSKFSMMTGKSRYFCDSCDVSQLVLSVCLIKHS